MKSVFKIIGALFGIGFVFGGYQVITTAIDMFGNLQEQQEKLLAMTDKFVDCGYNQPVQNCLNAYAMPGFKAPEITKVFKNVKAQGKRVRLNTQPGISVDVNYDASTGNRTTVKLTLKSTLGDKPFVEKYEFIKIDDKPFKIASFYFQPDEKKASDAPIAH